MNWKILTEYPDNDLAEKWEEFLTDAAYPSHYTTPNFFIDPFIRGGERFSLLTFDNAQQITAVLTGIDCGKKILSGLSTRPQLTLKKGVDRNETATALMKGLLEKGGDDLELINIYSWEEIKEIEDTGFRLQKSDDENSIIMLDLSKNPDEIFNEFSQTRRNEIRKAIKQNFLEIKELETEIEFRELYEIHKEWNDRKGNTPDTLEDMSLAVEQRDYRKIFLAKHSGKVIAGSFFRYCSGGLVEYAANNSLTEYQKFRPNDLIGWRAIQWACEQRFSHFSMGGSHLFLRRFGGDMFSSYRYSLDLTFLRYYDRKEQLEKAVQRIYLALPNSIRQKVKQGFGKT